MIVAIAIHQRWTREELETELPGAIISDATYTHILQVYNALPLGDALQFRREKKNGILSRKIALLLICPRDQLTPGAL